MSSVKKVVLGCSGGLDTSIVIPWIQENDGGAEGVAHCGGVHVRLFKGGVTAAGRRSPRSLYRADLANFGEVSKYEPKDAGGFMRVRAVTREGRGK